MDSIVVETPLGNLIAYPSGDPDYPGIWIDLRRKGCDINCGLTLVEVTKTEADLSDEESHVITRVWENAMEAEYADRIVHREIEEYFREAAENE